MSPGTLATTRLSEEAAPSLDCARKLSSLGGTMNWDAIGAIGEIVGAVAVVITLAYLAAQVRSGKHALRTNVRDSAFQQLQDWNLHLVQDEKLPLLFQQGARDLDGLDDAEQARFVHVAYSFIKLFENLYLHHRDGSLGAEGWGDTKAVIEIYLQQPGLQRYWQARKSLFNRDFAAYVDSLAPHTMPTAMEHLAANQ